MGWRSQEQIQKLKTKEKTFGAPKWKDTATNQRKIYAPGELPDNLPDKFFNEEGEVDLRQVTGNEAVKYLSLLGIRVPVGGGVSRS